MSHSPKNSTPLFVNSKHDRKRCRTKQHPGSESSVDGELSYLDLDTGHVLAATDKGGDVVLTSDEYDTMIPCQSSIRRIVFSVNLINWTN